MDNIEVVIPVYNEEDTIVQVLADIRNVLGNTCRIIVVDDASQDKTAQLAKENDAEVIVHPYNIGNGASIKTGIRHLKAEFVLLLDGDGQHLACQIPRLLEEIDRYDMIIGARDFSSPTLRNIANIFYNQFASYVTQFKIKDLTSGFRLLRREVALKFLYLLPNGFSYPSTITLAFLRTGRLIKYVPISCSKRKAGKSKIRIIPHGMKFLLIITRIATFFAPLRVFLPVSLILFLTGLLYYLYTFITMHRFTNMTVFLLISSIIIFMLGLISEQISQLRMDKTE